MKRLRAALLASGRTMPCVMVLDHCARAGAGVTQHGEWILIERAGLDGELLEQATYASQNCARVALIDVLPAGLRETTRAILAGAAQAFHEDAWYSKEERRREKTPYGKFVRRFMPAVRAEARAAARSLVKSFEGKNRLPVAIAYLIAERMSPQHSRENKDPTPEYFGHYLAMEAMGSGVAWTDSHPEHGFDVPRMESLWY